MKQAILIALVMSVMVLPLGFRQATAVDVDATASITDTCGLDFPTGDPISFSNLARNTDPTGTTTNQQLLEIENTGSVTSIITIAGTHWIGDDSSLQHLAVGKTKYALGTTATADPNSVNYETKVALSTTAADTYLGSDNIVVVPLVNNNTYWQLATTDMTNLPYSGGITQTITFAFSCMT